MLRAAERFLSVLAVSALLSACVTPGGSASSNLPPGDYVLKGFDADGSSAGP
jgi:hypothetical protein